MNRKRALILVVFFAGLFAFFAMAFLSEAKGLSAGQVVSNSPALLWNAFADVLGFFTSDLGLLILFLAGTVLLVLKMNRKWLSNNPGNHHIRMSDSLKSALKRLQAEVDASHPAATVLQGYSRDEFSDLLDREPLIRGVIDKACRHWISSGFWPFTQPDLAVFVAHRIADAHAFAGWIFVNGFQNPTKTEQQLLDFLLIANWEGNGIHRLRAKLIAMD